MLVASDNITVGSYFCFSNKTIIHLFWSAAWVAGVHQAIVKLFILVNNRPIKSGVGVACSAVIGCKPFLLQNDTISLCPCITVLSALVFCTRYDSPC